MRRILFLVIIICVALLFSGCVNTVLQNNPQCSVCVDVNKDNLCDRCGKAVTPSTSEESEESEHTECVDEDGNAKCDECNKKIPQEPTVEEPDEQPAIHTECFDTNDDGRCDGCDKELEIPIEEETLQLIENGKIKFAFVLASSVSGDVRLKIASFVKTIDDMGYGYATIEYEESESERDDVVEVLIGDISERDAKYQLNGRSYGYRGYAVRMVDGKIAIVAGSDNSLCTAIDYFKNDILKIEKGNVVRNAEFLKSDEKEYFHEYKITSVSIGDRDLEGYVIAVDKTDTEATVLARDIADKLYRYSGYDISIVDIGSVTDKYISIAHGEKTGGLGFYVNVNGSNLEIISEFSNKTVETGASYFLRTLADASGVVSLDEYTANVRDVYYEDFGAVGDGSTDDFTAIRNTHIHANKYGHTVVARDGARYYIGPTSRYVAVNTSVVWGSATFIVDDRNIDPTDSTYNINIFYFTSTLERVTLTPQNCEAIKQINENGGIDAESATKLDLGIGYPAMLEVYNKNHKVYIRTHLVNEGNDQYELVEVDAEGNIDPTTRFLLDYEEITSIVVRRLDEAPITIEGGHFITRVPQLTEHCQTYMSRGIVIARANVTVKNLSHEVTDENDDAGCPYGGFLCMQRGAYNIVVDGCTFMSHKTYNVINSNGVNTNMGTYDITIQSSNNVLFKNCTQSNFFENEAAGIPYFASERWGVMGSNYSKNIRYENCRLSRLDAHCGVYNVSLKNCEVVYISVVGGGMLTVEDTIIYNDNVIQLRGDYGSTWKGDILVKNVTLFNINEPIFFNAGWTNHDYGYKTYLPTTLTIDGLQIYRGNRITFFSDSFINKGDIGSDTHDGAVNENPMEPLGTIVVKNNSQNIEYVLLRNKFFADTELIFE